MLILKHDVPKMLFFLFFTLFLHLLICNVASVILLFWDEEEDKKKREKTFLVHQVMILAYGTLTVKSNRSLSFKPNSNIIKYKWLNNTN